MGHSPVWTSPRAARGVRWCQPSLTVLFIILLLFGDVCPTSSPSHVPSFLPYFSSFSPSSFTLSPLPVSRHGSKRVAAGFAGPGTRKRGRCERHSISLPLRIYSLGRTSSQEQNLEETGRKTFKSCSPNHRKSAHLSL